MPVPRVLAVPRAMVFAVTNKHGTSRALGSSRWLINGYRLALILLLDPLALTPGTMKNPSAASLHPPDGRIGTLLIMGLILIFCPFDIPLASRKCFLIYTGGELEPKETKATSTLQRHGYGAAPVPPVLRSVEASCFNGRGFSSDVVNPPLREAVATSTEGFVCWSSRVPPGG
ncbi:hypothetical protein UY3_00664 [Chelonia mydas]|uniref:Uncharacterized protein n=1 Tax=Chelonia mydas TaxID=8469 RepID=M7BXY0_CHEMY|nr:hypothetical protein UY3_00664 [Chelonia mydas]